MSSVPVSPTATELEGREIIAEGTRTKGEAMFLRTSGVIGLWAR